ncbi:MAG: hypothetical protein BWX71_01845 [Deltaproteobacteria bacterium ADurb.Bin072]|nr:MAG: hypothetical protein BWX71_01845 [Deltaproteobacteria bacterium ADurb.Bin072]
MEMKILFPLKMYPPLTRLAWQVTLPLSTRSTSSTSVPAPGSVMARAMRQGFPVFSPSTTSRRTLLISGVFWDDMRPATPR